MRKIKTGLGLLLAAVMLMGMAGVGWGIPSGLINMQGRLTNNPTDGSQPTAITVPTNCRFNLYTGPSGGSPIWTETQDVRPDSNGVFNVLLGTRYSLDNISVVDDSYYLEIQAEASPGAFQTLTPRQRLVSVPFAITAKNVRGGTVIATRVNATDTAGSSTAINGTAGDYGLIRPYDTTHVGHGVFGESKVASKAGIYGSGDGTNGYGVYGRSASGLGVFGDSTSGSGVRGRGAGGAGTAGVWGESTATNGWGIYGTSVSGYGVGGSGVNAGVWGTSTGTATTALPMLGAGVIGSNTQATISSGRIAAPGVYGESTNGAGVYGHKVSTATDTNPAVYGFNEKTTSGANPGVSGYSIKGYAVHGKIPQWSSGTTDNTNANPAIWGEQRSPMLGNNPGVKGTSQKGYGVFGESYSDTKAGVYARNSGPDGISNNADDGPALEVGSGTIKIQKGWISQTAVNGEVVIDAVCGSIYLKEGSSYVIVANKFINRETSGPSGNNSIVLLSLGAQAGGSDLAIRNYNLYGVVDSVRQSRLAIHLNRAVNRYEGESGGRGHINFLVIN